MKRLSYLEKVDLNIQRALGQTAAQVYALVKTFSKLSEGVCSASEITMAEQLGVSWRSVSRALKILEQEGLIRCIGTSKELKTKQYVPLRDAWRKYHEEGPELSKSNKVRRYGGNNPTWKPRGTRVESRQRQQAVSDFNTHVHRINTYDRDAELFGDPETPGERELRRSKEDQLLIHLARLADIPREQVDEILETRRFKEIQRLAMEVVHVR